MNRKMLCAVLCAAIAAEVFAGLFADGKFRVGCNYWASHAGMTMWQNWDAVQVERDLAANDVAIFEVRP